MFLIGKGQALEGRSRPYLDVSNPKLKFFVMDYKQYELGYR